MKTGELRLASDAQLAVAIGRFPPPLSEVYRRHAPAAFGLAQGIAADGALAEEVVQEVFLRRWNQPDRFDAARGSLRTYLLTQTHGRSVDVIRAEAAWRAREERDARMTSESSYDLEREVWDLTQAEHVRDALGLLSEGERRAIELAYVGGHTYREVAVLLPRGSRRVPLRSDGFLLQSNLRALPPDRTYELWALMGGSSPERPISAGVLGPDPGITAFRVHGPVVGFAITDEQSPGVVSPSNPPLIRGAVS